MTRVELFWRGRTGMLLILATVWVVGGTALAFLVLDRPQAEPCVRKVIPTLLSMLATRAFYHPHFRYTGYDYLGLEGAVGFIVLAATVVTGYMLLPKPAQDRRIDAYLASRRRDP